MNDILNFITQNNLPEIDLGKSANQWHKLETADFKGSYIYNVTTYKDKAVTILTVYNFRTGERLTERFGADNLTKAELQDVDKKIKEQNERAEQEKIRKQLECREYAQKEFNLLGDNYDDVRTNPYMVRKQLSGLLTGIPAEGRKFNLVRSRPNPILQRSELVIPFYDIEGVLWNYQSITDAGEKQVLIGGKLQGLFHPITNTKLKSATRVYLCEGYSTALTVFLALEQKFPVLACISSTNLKYVAQAIRKHYPRLPYIICGDNDQWKPHHGNAGEMASLDTVSGVDGGAFGLPDFSKFDTSGKPTDYNDLLCLAGLREVSEQVSAIKASRPQIIYSLGYSGRNYFFTTSRVPQIQVLTEFTETDMIKLAGLQYLTEHFADERGTVDFQLVKDRFIRECQDKGIFRHENMRGRGFYLERSDAVFHVGDKVIFPKDFSENDLSDFESDHYYDPEAKHQPEVTKE